MKFILGKKIEMTEKFLTNGTVIPVTRVMAGPCFVTKKIEKNGPAVNSIQLAFENKKFTDTANPLKGFFRKVFNRDAAFKALREFRLTTKDEIFDRLNVGDEITVEAFKVGDKTEVHGVSKGMGFQGVVKRFHFRGHPGHHGHKDQLRMPGSSGATGQGHVFPGTRKPGRMGEANVTIKNLEVVEVIPGKNEIWLKGAVPGFRGALIAIEAPGEFEIKKQIGAPAEIVPAEVVETKAEKKA